MIAAVELVDYDPRWAARFEQERQRIEEAGGPGAFLRIEHIGSTSVPGLTAKPIIDLMPGVASLDEALDLIPRLCAIGYDYLPEHERVIPERRYFRRDVAGVRAFHLHLVEVGGPFWLEHLLFRDHLRTHPASAEAYGRLKRELAGRAAEDRAAYLDGKSAFVDEVLRVARGGE